MPAEIMRKRRHHYVPKWYLEAWADDGRVFCLREGQIVHPALKHMAVEQDFYAVRDLMPEDVEVIRRGIIAASDERVRTIHEQLLTAFVF